MSNFDVSKLARNDLKFLKPYEPAIYPGAIRLDANECPFELPDEIIDHVLKNKPSQLFNRYPDPLAEGLLELLGNYTGYPKECISAGNGSDEIILDLALTFATGGEVIITSPTFSMYELHALIAGAQTVYSPRKEDFNINVQELIELGNSPDARLIYICSPNNPTANETSWSELETVLNNVRSLVIVDEAYVEFGGKSCLPLVKEYENLAVLRSFSKSFGLAGLRIGYLIANNKVISQIRRVKQPYNLNSFSQAIAEAVIANLPLFQERIKSIITKRDKLWNTMKSIKGIEVFPTVTNFIPFKTEQNAKNVYHELIKRKIVIRDISGPGLENCFRVTIGTDEENELFVHNLREIMS